MHNQSYEQRALDSMRPDLKRLQAATKTCRIDMHEPDEQEISAVFTGTHLDNAMGDDPMHNCCEFTVGIVNGEGHTEWFNLATLIAMARLANLQ